MLTSPAAAAASCASSCGVVSASGVLSCAAASVPAVCTFALEGSAELSASLPPQAAMLIAMAAVKDKVSNFFAFNFFILL